MSQDNVKEAVKQESSESGCCVSTCCGGKATAEPKPANAEERGIE